jgi:hypothetical protein
MNILNFIYFSLLICWWLFWERGCYCLTYFFVETKNLLDSWECGRIEWVDVFLIAVPVGCVNKVTKKHESIYNSRWFTEFHVGLSFLFSCYSPNKIPKMQWTFRWFTGFVFLPRITINTGDPPNFKWP